MANNIESIVQLELKSLHNLTGRCTNVNTLFQNLALEEGDLKSRVLENSCLKFLQGSIIDATKNGMDVEIPYVLDRFAVKMPYFFRFINGGTEDEYQFSTKSPFNQFCSKVELSFVLRQRKAFTTAKPKILNSDKGSYFTSSDYIRLLEENQIAISMAGKGRATDNAVTERFFHNLNWEKLYYNTYTTPKQVYRDVRAYIDEYNRTRPHQSLAYAKPIEFYHHAVDTAG